MPIRIYTSEHCGPCGAIGELVKKGNYQADDSVELVDVGTDEGFERFFNEVLQHGDGALPSAYRDGKKCILGFDEEGSLLVDCTTEGPPASEPAK